MSDILPVGGDGRVQSQNNPALGGGRPVKDYVVGLDEDSIELREILGVVRRNGGLVLGIAAAVVAVAVFFLLRQVPEYRAEALLRLRDERGSMTGGMAGTAMQEVMGKTADPVLSQLQVMRSRGVATEVIERTGLRLHSVTQGFSAGILEDIEVVDPRAADTLSLSFDDMGAVARSGGGESRVPYGSPVRLGNVQLTIPARPEEQDEAEIRVLTREQAIDRFRQNLEATIREETDVIDLAYTDPDPALAQRVVNATVDVFREVSARTAQQQARRRRIFLEEQLTQTDSALTLAQLALTNFQSREGVASSQEKLAAQQVGLMDLDIRREELDADRRVLQSLLAALSREDQPGRRLGALVSNPGIAENPAVTELYQQMVRLEASRDSLAAGRWGSADTSPDVERFDLLIGSTRSRLVEAVESHVEALDARIAALDDLKSRNLAELQALPASGAEEVRLVQQVEGVGKVADQLREEYQKARIAEAVEAGQVEVIDLASLPAKPIGSGPGLKLALALVLGLMLGSGAAVLKENLNTSIRRKEDLEVLRLPGLAVIPQITGSAAEQRFRFPLMPARSGSTNGNGAHPPEGDPRELVAVSHLRSPGAEAYRTLRTNLIFSQAVQSLKTLVITSTAPSEGKTTTSSNLAVTFAQQGMRVLLVDCDLRKGRLNTVFRIPREPGLTQLILGFNEPAEVIRETAVDGLSVIASGTFPPNPSELLGGDKMRETLAALQEQFDLVILDTPPLLAAADAAVLGRGADGVLLVIRAGHTDRGAAQHAMEQLQTVGAHVVGAVLNDPDAKAKAYGGYYYYSYYGAEV